MKKTRIFLLIELPVCLFLTVSFCLLPGIAMGADNKPTPAEIVGKMQFAYENATTIMADFSQEVIMRSTETKKTETGVCFFKRPLKMRWAYQEPRHKLLVIGAELAWFYLPEKKIAYRLSTTSLLPSQTVIRLLVGIADLKKDFRIELLEAGANGYTLRLKPFEKAANIGAKEITMMLDKESFLITRCVFDDLYGNRNVLMFKGARINEELSDSLFNFNAPADVQVVEMK